MKSVWGNVALERFIQKVADKIEMIGPFPGSCQKSPFEVGPGVRRCVINKNVSLYYEVVNNEVHLLSFFQNRMNPDRLTDLLN